MRAGAPEPAPTVAENYGDCRGPRAYEQAAKLNAESVGDLSFVLFGRPERGWAVYAPAIGREVSEACPPDSPRFGAALADWQGRHGLAVTGVVDPATLMVLKGVWQERRPFVRLRTQGVCPDAPDEAALAQAAPGENRWGKVLLLRPRALAAYRRMVAAAHAVSPELARSPDLLTIFSAYRSPSYDAARCARERNCQGVVRAACSAHRTGLAMDIDVGSAPGLPVDSTADENRLAMSRGPAYHWLVANAARYGFVNYPFEPWHWEWTGEAP